MCFGILKNMHIISGIGSRIMKNHVKFEEIRRISLEFGSGVCHGRCSKTRMGHGKE
jgi:hypothetical protein